MGEASGVRRTYVDVGIGLAAPRWLVGVEQHDGTVIVEQHWVLQRAPTLPPPPTTHLFILRRRMGGWRETHTEGESTVMWRAKRLGGSIRHAQPRAAEPTSTGLDAGWTPQPVLRWCPPYPRTTYTAGRRMAVLAGWRHARPACAADCVVPPAACWYMAQQGWPTPAGRVCEAALSRGPCTASSTAAPPAVCSTAPSPAPRAHSHCGQLEGRRAGEAETTEGCRDSRSLNTRVAAKGFVCDYNTSAARRGEAGEQGGTCGQPSTATDG